VVAAATCCDRLVASKPFDANDKLIGIYPTAGDGMVALLGQPTDAI
jgi:hypothetical protein